LNLKHPLQRRIFVEELVRRRAPDERRRYAAAQRRGRIDANPHQIDAVVFALDRIAEGGCILADEVGLGKTIEAGLIMAQMLAEGTERILILVPKPLLGQWCEELHNLFSIATTQVAGDPETLLGEGVFVAGREWAGNEAGSSLLRTADPFDLVIIDEAHEIFAGIHRRYDADGVYQEDAKTARIAHRVRQAIGLAPVLLLTATPIQNTLLELWGLVQYVEPTGTLLGDLPTFRELFCDDAGRSVQPARSAELRRRMGQVLQRTLRRQAQPFLDQPFVGRSARLFHYEMSDDERQLYDDVTDYVMRPGTVAFEGASRTLLRIVLHRQMASSSAALASSLEAVAARLRNRLDAGEKRGADGLDRLLQDLDEEDVEELVKASEETSDGVDDASGDGGDEAAAPSRDALRDELDEVEDYVSMARALPADSKARALLRAVDLTFERGEGGEGSGKLVVFSESLVTQDYLRDLLVAHGVAEDDITLFRGTNDSARAKDALARWEEECAAEIPAERRPPRSIAVRLGLVHEFRTRSRIFLSSEAGAKGLNLQFCETVVNYDLPWNPQRIEQRIGRCHRYGQLRDVTVINFLAKDNEAQRLTFSLLSQKLELFGRVLDASDAVLHQPGATAPEALVSTVGAGFEASLRAIYSRARTREEVEAELRALREAVDSRREEFDACVDNTASLIESRLDERVRTVFQAWQSDLPEVLRQLDTDLRTVVDGWLRSISVGSRAQEFDRHAELQIDASPLLPAGLTDGLVVGVGDVRGAGRDIEHLHLEHPLVLAAVAGARQEELRGVCLQGPPELGGSKGRLGLVRVRHKGLRPGDVLHTVAVLENGTAVDPTLVQQLLESDVRDAQLTTKVDGEAFDDAVEDAVFDDLSDRAERSAAHFDRLMDQIERYIDDRIVVKRRRAVDLRAQLEVAEHRRANAAGTGARQRAVKQVTLLIEQLEATTADIHRLSARDDADYQRWRHRALERRHARPEVTSLFTVDFVVEAGRVM
jgi:hypothetical protein